MGPEDTRRRPRDEPARRRPADLPFEGTATITAIHVLPAAPDIALFGLHVAPDDAPPFAAGSCQAIPFDRLDAHLGATVPVHHDGRRARVDWPGARGPSPWSSPGAPRAGVHDPAAHASRLRVARGRPVLATVLGAHRRDGDGPTHVDVELHVMTGRSVGLVRVAHEEVPFYARHLLGAGTILPAALDPADGTAVIDWAAAADGAVSRRVVPPGSVLSAFATGGLGATSVDAPGLRRPAARRPSPGRD